MFFSKFETMVAGRYLRAKRSDGFVSLITAFAYTAIALGVATLIIVMSVMGGFRHELLSRILGINGHISIVAPGGYPFNNYQLAIKEIESINNVEIVTPLIEGQVLASSDRASTGAMVRGISKEDIVKKAILRDSISHINLNDFEENSVIIGSRLARRLGIYTGDEITIISPEGKMTAFGTVPRMKSYKIIGTFELGMYEYDSSFIFMPFDTAQIFFNAKNAVTNIDIVLKDAEVLSSVKQEIEIAVGNNASVYDWKQTNASFFNAIEVERNVMFLILTLIVLVAGFNIVTALIMIVKDKGKDIAVLRTMGATKAMIMRIFFMDGAFIGIVGTLLGVSIGLLFCYNIESIRQFLEMISGRELFSAEIYFLSQLPAKVDLNEVATIGTTTLLISFLATIYPAYRASKFDPVEALRYE